MSSATIRTVAVVGAGVIGRSWIQVFARAGCTVAVYDADPRQLARALRWVEADIEDLRSRRQITRKEATARLGRIRRARSLEDALEGVRYVQESGPESIPIKQALYRDLDRAAPPDAIIGSSTSAFDMTAIADGLPGAARCIVAHPVNPPHVVPAVEILGGAKTDTRVVTRTIKFMKALGQTPVLMHKFTPGFVLNRMQAALIREAVHLVASGVCDVQAVDDSIRDGLGLRWALMGPFGVANTNADTGVREYFTRFREAYHGLWDQLDTSIRFDDQLVERLGVQTDRMMKASLREQRAWRDRLVEGIRALKAADPLGGRRRRR